MPWRARELYRSYVTPAPPVQREEPSCETRAALCAAIAAITLLSRSLSATSPTRRGEAASVARSGGGVADARPRGRRAAHRQAAALAPRSRVPCDAAHDAAARLHFGAGSPRSARTRRRRRGSTGLAAARSPKPSPRPERAGQRSRTRAFRRTAVDRPPDAAGRRAQVAHGERGVARVLVPGGGGRWRDVMPPARRVRSERRDGARSALRHRKRKRSCRPARPARAEIDGRALERRHAGSRRARSCPSETSDRRLGRRLPRRAGRAPPFSETRACRGVASAQHARRARARSRWDEIVRKPTPAGRITSHHFQFARFRPLFFFFGVSRIRPTSRFLTSGRPIRDAGKPAKNGENSPLDDVVVERVTADKVLCAGQSDALRATRAATFDLTRRRWKHRAVAPPAASRAASRAARSVTAGKGRHTHLPATT